MKRQDFYFDLPDSLIAQYPLEKRTDSRLLIYKNATYTHDIFHNIIHYLNPGDLLVLNNTAVIPARFFGKKDSGGQVEFLLERILTPQTFMAHIKASKPPRSNTLIYLEDGTSIRVIEKKDDLYHCQLNAVDRTLDDMLNALGRIPLPPYITRAQEKDDVLRYQTVFAKHKGSVAAPTAGLHFDETLLALLRDKGIDIAYTTLHVGAGTFKPVRVDVITDHSMHSEYCVVDKALCEAVMRAKNLNKRVIAVGTTAVRSLESAATTEGIINPYQGDTRIFIYPGYTFKICDGILTNFHLPESTLLMLVSAFIGHDNTMALYREAIEKQYRFFSYGDTSLLFKEGV